MLISFAVTAKLICVFVFAYAKIRFSHVEAHFVYTTEQFYLNFREITETFLAVIFQGAAGSKHQ